MSNNKNDNNKPSSSQANNIMGIAAIIVVGIFVICVIVVLAKGLFASNSAKVPDGLYTGTLSSNVSAPDEHITESSADSSQSDTSAADSSTGDTDSSAADSSSQEESSQDESSQDDSSTAEVTGEKAYITEYAYLRTEPSQDGEQIICMSPNLEVTVLERGFDGYCKVTFMNFDTPLEGYVYEGYLSQSPIG